VEQIGMMAVMVSSGQIRGSAKWAAASFVPAMLLGFLLAGIAGGLHGGGKLIFLIFVAPMFFLGNHIEYLPVVVMWAAIIGVQILYWFIIVFVFRALGVHKVIGAWLTRLRSWIQR
jgi:hypothetical protein